MLYHSLEEMNSAVYQHFLFTVYPKLPVEDVRDAIKESMVLKLIVENNRINKNNWFSFILFKLNILITFLTVQGIFKVTTVLFINLILCILLGTKLNVITRLPSNNASMN